MRMKRLAALLLSGILFLTSAPVAFAEEPDGSVQVMAESEITEPAYEEEIVEVEVVEAETEGDEEEEKIVEEEEIVEEEAVAEEVFKEDTTEEETFEEIVYEEPEYVPEIPLIDVYAGVDEAVYVPTNLLVDEDWNFTYQDEFIIAIELEAGKVYKLSGECEDVFSVSLYDSNYNYIDVYFPDGYIPGESGTYYINVSAAADATVVVERTLAPVAVSLLMNPYDTSYYAGIEYCSMEGLLLEAVYEDGSVLECEAFDENWGNVISGWCVLDENAENRVDDYNPAPGNYFFCIDIAYTGQQFLIPFEVKDMADIPTLSLNDTTDVTANSFFLSEDGWFVGDSEYFRIDLEEGKEYLFTGENTYFSVFTPEEDGSVIYYDWGCCEYRYQAEKTGQFFLAAASMLDDVISFSSAPEKVEFVSATAWLDKAEFEYGEDPMPEGLRAEVYYSNGDVKYIDIPAGFNLEVLESMGVSGWTVFAADGTTFADSLRDSKGNLPVGEYFFGLMLEGSSEYDVLCSFAVKKAPEPVKPVKPGKPCNCYSAPIVKAVVKVVTKQICSIVSGILRCLF